MNAQSSFIFISRDPSAAKRVEAMGNGVIGHLQRITVDEGMALETLLQQGRIFLVDLRRDPESALTLAHQLKMSKATNFVAGVHDEKPPELLLKALRYSLDDFLDLSDPETVWRESLRKGLVMDTDEQGRGETIGVFSLKGGQGVTTLAIHVADWMMRLSNQRVLLLDMHLDYSHVANYFNQSFDYTPSQLVADLERMDDVLLSSSISQNEDGLSLLAAQPSQVSVADVFSEQVVESMIDLLRRHYHFTVIDLPHHLSAPYAAALRKCDHLLLPFRQDAQAIRALQTVVGFLQEIDLPQQSIHPILMGRTAKSTIRESDLGALLPFSVFQAIDENVAHFSTAQERNTLLRNISAGCREDCQLKQLAGMLTGIQTVRKRSWLNVLTGSRG